MPIYDCICIVFSLDFVLSCVCQLVLKNYDDGALLGAFAISATFSKLGAWEVQFLGLGYYAEQNMDGIPSFVHCSVLRNGNHTLRQKVGVVRPNFGGSGPPTPRGCALARMGVNLVGIPRDAGADPQGLIGSMSDVHRGGVLGGG